MPRKSEIAVYAGINLILILLKLFGVFTISWAWVLLPLWGPVALAVFVVFFGLLFVTLSGGQISVKKTDKTKGRGEFDF